MKSGNFSHPFRNRTAVVSAPPPQIRRVRAKTAAGSRHLARVKSLPCACCEASAPSDAHHIREGQGGAQRAPDFLAIPLCKECHQGTHGVHGDKALMRIKKLDELDMLAATIQRLTNEGACP